MAAASNYTENLAVQWLLTTSTPTRPTAWFVSLYTSATDDATGGTEVTGGAYARQAVTFTVSNDTARNTATLTFPTATANWGTITHLAVHDAVTGGNRLFHGPVAVSKTVTTDDVFQISTNNLAITFA
jgi:hypothetical protein